MKYVIDLNVLKKNNLTKGEFLYLMLNMDSIPILDIKKSLIAKGFATEDLFSATQVVVSNNVKNLVSKILAESTEQVEKSSMDFEAIADKLMEAYWEEKKTVMKKGQLTQIPVLSGCKPGTSYVWVARKEKLVERLKKMVAKYNISFTPDEAYKAARCCINNPSNRENNFKFLPLLQYFILKVDKTQGEVNSPLADYLANLEYMEESETPTTTDWVTTLV